MTPERATFPPPYSWVLGREKTGATYKVEGVVPGNMSHTRVSCSGFWSGNASRNPRARPESLQHRVPQMAGATGHTLPGRAFQSRPHRSCPHTSSGAGLLLASWCLSYPANGHTAISQLPWAGKPDKTKVPIGDTSQFTEC